MHKLEWQWDYRLTLQHFVHHNNTAAIWQVTDIFPKYKTIKGNFLS